jgi:uncharacterized protein YecE (DUF72 family)
MNLFVGTSGFSYKEWKGSFYPKDIPAAQMLQFYSEHFRSVEINNTFYGIPKVTAVAEWAREVAADFQFAIKAPQRITHRRDFTDAPATMSQLLEAVGPLKKRLGPLLFQLPPYIKKDATRLRELLGLLRPRQRGAFEFRHPSWFDKKIFDMLRDHSSALCIADDDNDMNIPFVATADWGYLRLRRLDYTGTALEDWIKRIRRQEWKDAFVFFKHEDTGKGPQFAARFIELAAAAAEI